MYTDTTLDIVGYLDWQVPNTFVRSGEPASQLAVFYPGFGYTCDMPLFYYTEKILLDVGADILRVEYGYNQQPEFRELAAPVRYEWQRVDAVAAIDTVLAERDYQRIIIVGKSLGTRAMGHVLSSDQRLLGSTAVWLTPLFMDDNVRRQVLQTNARSLVVIGTADPHYDPEILEEFGRKEELSLLTIPGGDHSLDIENDIDATIRSLGLVLAAIQNFVS